MLVDTSIHTVSQLKGQTPGDIKIGLNSLAREWAAVKRVELAQGTTIPVDNTYLLAALQASVPHLDQIENIFTDLQRAHLEHPAQLYSTSDLQPLEQILARPEFQGLVPAQTQDNQWLSKLWDSFVRWLRSLYLRIFGKPPGSISIDTSMLTSPLAILSAVLLILMIAYVLRSLLVDFSSDAILKESGDGADETLSAEGAFEKAQRLSRERDFRSAVRYLYLSSLLLLDERGLLRYDRSKTNREYLRSVSYSPEIALPFRDVIQVFDDVWYGYHSLDEASFKHYSRRVEEIKDQVK